MNRFARGSFRRFFKYARKIVKNSTAIIVMLFLLLGDVQFIFPNLDFFDVPQAHAATGDFAIFRENTGTETVVSASALDVTWDTTVQSNSNIALQGNSSDIDLADGGKYLVMYNVWTEQGTSTAGTNRRSHQSWITLAGAPLEYGRGGSYLRDNSGVTYAYNSGSAIIDASTGDDLQVHIQRDDANTTAGMNVRPATNGVNVLKLKDSWDYLRIHKSTNSGDIGGNTTFTDVTWDTDDEVDTGSFGFTPTSGNITLKGDDDDHFLVTANVRLNRTSNSQRENFEMALTLDGVEIPGTRVTSYMRGNTNGNNDFDDALVYTGLIKKDSVGDQTLNVEVRRESSSTGGTTVIVGDETALTMVALPDEGNYIMLGNDGSTSVGGTRSGLDWTTQDEIDSYAFSHSTTTNASRVEIDTAGDYLFFSTLYATTTSAANDRQTFRADWRKNGSTFLNYGSFGQYNRNNTTFTSGASGALIMDSLTATDYIELTQFDESGAPTDLAFEADRVALQGILLDENFFGTDVFVSATSSHTVETDVPTTDVYGGGGFVIQEQSGTRNVTSITITESGSVDAQNGLDNIELYYDLDTTTPYDCTGESYNSGSDTQFGATDTTGFSGADGVSSFSGSVEITTTKTMCVYVVYDVTASSSDVQTVELSIDDPSTDVDASGSPSVGPVTAVAPTGSTTLRNAELTMTHYRWLNDDGVEGSASAIENEDTSTVGFANGTTRRLRAQVDAAGSTSSLPTVFQIDYATKTAACNTLTIWEDIGVAGGAWDMSNTGNITDGTNATNIGTGSGGVSDPSGPPTFLATNGGLRDTNSTTSALTLADDEFVEFEFAIEPTLTAPQGNTYCFRVSDNGTALRNYDIFAEGTISADVDVSASSSQVTTLDAGATGQYVGGTFVIERPGANRTLTSITISESGSIDAQNNLDNIEIYYDLDTTTPYDCTGETYNVGSDAQWGVTDTDGFSGADGISTFTGSQSIRSTQAFCGYVVFDIGSGATNGETITVEIADPSTDVVVTSSSVGPSTAVSPTGSTTIAGPVVTQTHYHWRNDDGDETDTGATSATGGVEDTEILAVPKESLRRLRMQVSNEGTVSSQSTQYILEYGTKVVSCEGVSTWINVGATGGAFDMSLSSNISDGNTTDVDTAGNGAMTEENTTFVGTGALRETEATSSAITLSSTQFAEFEYAIEATVDSGYDTTYCFRVSADGTELPVYNSYAELTTREKQDFFIQRGTETVSGTSVTLTAGVDYTAPSATSSAFVRISDSHMTGAADNIGTNGQQADDVTAYISDQSDVTSSFTISRPSSATSNTRVDWEIVEFVGLPGTDNEIKVRGVGEVAFTSTEFTDSGATTDVVTDDDDVVVFITGQQNQNGGTGEYNDGLFSAEWNATNTQPDFTRGDADVSADVSYAVVEFTGANWKIQRLEHTYTTAGVAETETMTAIGAISRAFLHTQKHVGEGLSSIDEGGHLVHVSSIGAVTFELRNTAQTPGDHVSVAWVIENTQTGTGAMASYQSTGELNNPDAEPATYSVSIGAEVNTANASIWGNNTTSGTGTTYPRLHTGFTIASSTHYEIYRSDTNNDMEYRVEVVEWPVADTSIRQNYYRFYVDNDALDPTDPWPVGASDLGENFSITGSDDPLGEGDRVRLRMSLLINNATLAEQTTSFKLQYGKQDTTCSAIASWSDVGAVSSGSIWRAFSTSITDGTELATSTPAPGTLNLSVSDVAGSFEEENNSVVNPYSIDLGEDVEYDWVLEHNGATQLSDYCFRMIKSDDTELDGYNNYPTLRTTGYTPVIGNWQWFNDATSTTPSASLASENVAPVDLENQNEVKLRVTATEVEGAPGTNIKFALQFSEYVDFSDGGTYVVSTSSCLTNSLWCYVDGAGVDNAVIDSALLSDADSCTGGTGDGCGSHNEAATTSSSINQSSLASTEFEFTLKHAGARANAVYYFRLYDVTNDVVVAASSSYPSVVTEGATLTFSLNGLDAAVVTEGVTLDATTTPTAISFGSVPFDTQFEMAQRISVDTNATEGYQVLVYSDQDLTNTYGGTIPTVTGTNPSPSGWASGCVTTDTGCFGYHAGDDLLAGGSARFGADDSYAAFVTTPQEVLYSSVPTNESHDIVYKIQVGQEQPAGDYEKTITYIAVPVF